MLVTLALPSISTHALTEGDEIIQCGTHYRDISTHALTEGDKFPMADNLLHHISTHALTEGDSIGYFFLRTKRYFNSRPHGGRH